jgi:hypothetical protein
MLVEMHTFSILKESQRQSLSLFNPFDIYAGLSHHFFIFEFGLLKSFE